MRKLLSRIGITTALLVGGSLGGVVAPVALAQAATPPPSYVAVTPVRLLDTRTTTPAAAGSETKLKVTGLNGVPADASAVWVNLTAVNPDADGHITVYPCGATRPVTANVNYFEGATKPNAVLAGVGTDGEVCIWTLAKTDMTVDLNGYVPSAGSPTPIVPFRSIDTRLIDKASPPAAGSETKIKIAGENGVPADATAVMVNLTAIKPEADGHFTVYPCGATRAETANGNYTKDSVSPNALLSGLGPDGDLCVWTLAKTHMTVDVMGFVPAGGTPVPVVPFRPIDTRKGTKPAAGSDTKVKIAGANGIPASATAVMMNVTSVRAEADGHLTVYPCGAQRAETANVNYKTWVTSPNAVLSGIGTNGEVCIWTMSASDIVVDVMAYVPATQCTVAGSVVASDLPVSECDALVAFYNGLDGPNWTSQGNWNTATDPCTWEGVTCDAGHVTKIERASKGLKGEVPPEIGHLPMLVELNLQDGAVSKLPAEISALTNLEMLDVGKNKLTEIPPEIDKLTKLTSLNMGDNAITALPVELGTLTALTSLVLSNNMLAGDITPVFKPLQTGAAGLTTLSLSGNGCLTSTDADLTTWLNTASPGWNDGC